VNVGREAHASAPSTDGREASAGTEDLRPPEEVARIIARVAGSGADKCAGQVVSAREPELRRRAGIA
jgi:hypothetical protein